MEQSFAPAKVTVEYFDPHGVYKLIAPGLIPRLPLHDLHWQSHAGPLRSIQNLHVDLLPTGTDFAAAASPITPNPRAPNFQRSGSITGRDDGFQTTAIGGGGLGTLDQNDAAGVTLRVPGAGKERRHQIPGLRRTPYLKVLFVRCDDNDMYKATTRAEIREWIKENTVSAQRKSTSTAENHDAFEWLIVHVVLPNSAAAFQPRQSTVKSSDSNPDVARASTTSRWRPGSSTLLEKMRSDFNTTKGPVEDRVAQIRIGINDLPFDILPRVVPAIPTGYIENEQDAEVAWGDLIGKFKGMILSSFNMRVSQYEEDIKEKDAQRTLPGWNFCTFFMLKEGLARGFESVGLVEDALMYYDELSIGLDTILQEQLASGSSDTHAGTFLSYTQDLKEAAKKAMSQVAHGNMGFEDEEAVDLQSKEVVVQDRLDEIPISSAKKAYRDLILANNVSIFDFRCYIFARQLSLLLRLANAWSTPEELLAKLNEQQESVLRGGGTTSQPSPLDKDTEEPEDLSRLAEVCRRALRFIPSIMLVMRHDILSGLAPKKDADQKTTHAGDYVISEVVDNVMASYAFSLVLQILAQTVTKALPIPLSDVAQVDGHEPKSAIPEPKTMMHPARKSSLPVRAGGARPHPGSDPFADPSRKNSLPDIGAAHHRFLKAGLEELSAKRAEVYALGLNILTEFGKKRGWSDGWASVPVIGETGVTDMEDISLDDDKPGSPPTSKPVPALVSAAGIENQLLRAALDNKGDFYRLYETLLDKTLRHYHVAGHNHSVQAYTADLAVLHYHLGDHSAAASYFYRTIPFYGESAWSLLELSMLIMYAQCLKEVGKKSEYQSAVRKLLAQAAAAEKDRLHTKSSVQRAEKAVVYPDALVIAGFLTDVLEISDTFDKVSKWTFDNFFSDVEVEGMPAYDDGQDSFSITLKLRSLFVDHFEVQRASMRIVSPTSGGNREIWLEAKSVIRIKPGYNKVQLFSNVSAAGIYEIDQLVFTSHNIALHLERDVSKAVGSTSTILRKPKVALFQRASSLDVRLAVARDVQLDKNNMVELEVLPGWNHMLNCEVKVKPGTGGLRLLTAEAAVVGTHQPSKTPEAGVFVFGAVPADASIKIRLPFTFEQDLLSVSVRVEVSYSTDRGSFTFFKNPSAPVGLLLGVNVQDVFKHNALFSRFTVSTATSSPLRLFQSELLESETFEPHFGGPAGDPVVIFPKQPASLLYMTTRKKGSKLTPTTQKTMYLKLYYSLLLDEIEDLYQRTLLADLKETPLWEYSRLVVSNVISRVHASLTAYDLERCALLSEVGTASLVDVEWERYFSGLGIMQGQDASIASRLAGFIRTWQTKHSKLVLQGHDAASSAALRTILIPVDIPSVTIVHTADIQLQDGVPAFAHADPDVGTGAVCINQVLSATLHLKWTRVWDTGDLDSSGSPAVVKAFAARKGAASAAMLEDLEFSYEVTAPTDTWLLGGRRKGHFVIPSVTGLDGDAGATGLSSTPDTEADIPLVLIPLREGWLPYPTVEIREVKNAVGAGGAVKMGAEGDNEVASPVGHCELDYRNLGETLRVIADRARVTLSLDASGPGGGPLVLESQRAGLGGKVVA